ncbi:NPCBM/NEW2 domain-containing protein [Streptomyces sp. NPDC005899]|uniref:NPCBM/NEW2 domain-containing protein n=1 Tax=Streptomyces sp. NPDC005899 TaxID=3155716 RepID=UPI0033CE2E3B
MSELAYAVAGDHGAPEILLAGSRGVFWQRSELSIGSAPYAHGVTIHARSSVTIRLNRPCTRYGAMVGVDDMTRGLGAVRFSVFGGGEDGADVRLWESPVLRGGDAAVPVDLGIGGHRTIRLVVEPAEPFSGVALADWAQSVINCP